MTIKTHEITLARNYLSTNYGKDEKHSFVITIEVD